ncbi:hypothetical protein ACWEJQ_16560 [Streptomyces albidoflavus]
MATRASNGDPRRRGAVVYDTVSGRAGEYVGQDGAHAVLRPVGGGGEWRTDPERVRAATLAERLSAGVQAANRRARQTVAQALDVDPDRPPQAVAGCAECARLDRERAAARAAFDWSAQTDANVLLRPTRTRTTRPEPAPERGQAGRSPRSLAIWSSTKASSGLGRIVARWSLSMALP